MLDYFVNKFDENATTLQMANNLANVLTKNVKELENIELLLLLQVYRQYVPDASKKIYNATFDDIIDTIENDNMTGKDFIFNTIEELVIKFGYSKDKFYEHQTVLYETYTFLNDY